MTTIGSSRELDDLVVDGKITDEDAHAVRRFRAFLRNVGAAPLDDEGRHLIDAETYAYASGEDVDPRGTGDPW